MEPQTIARGAADLAEEAKELAEQALTLAQQAQQIALTGAEQVAGHDFISMLTVFALACFVGYYVVWSVTPALHSPLMGVTNAISSVIVVGALIATGTGEFGFSQVMGFLAVMLASVNIFGGFIVTHRMLSMFKKKAR